MTGAKCVFGAGSISAGSHFETDEIIIELYDILERGGCTTLDTAQMYSKSEELLGKTNAGARFIIDTKALSGLEPKQLGYDTVLKGAHESIRTLGVKKVDVFYFHGPDEATPIAESLAAVNQAHQDSLFERFGLSNYSAESVKQIYDHCKEHKYVLPTVYQGNYSAVARKFDTLLFPTLRELGIAFYAYSPIAGGFLAKTKQEVLDGKGRFNTDNFFGQLYARMFAKPSYLEALAEWGAIAEQAGVSRSELAYRWVKYNSPLQEQHGDAIIFGGRTLEQVKETLEGLQRGPLNQEACRRIDAIWEQIKHEAPMHNNDELEGMKASS